MELRVTTRASKGGPHRRPHSGPQAREPGRERRRGGPHKGGGEARRRNENRSHAIADPIPGITGLTRLSPPAGSTPQWHHAYAPLLFVAHAPALAQRAHRAPESTPLPRCVVLGLRCCRIPARSPPGQSRRSRLLSLTRGGRFPTPSSQFRCWCFEVGGARACAHFVAWRWFDACGMSGEGQ